MPQVSLCVSPFVRAVLIARYGASIIHVHRTDILYTYLQGDPVVANAHKYRNLGKVLTASITIEASQIICSRLRARKRNILVGYFLHKVFQEEVLVFMDAQVKAGVAAQAALRNWLAAHNVQEDDYSLETAYTGWLRKRRFFAAIAKKRATAAPVFNSHPRAPRIPSDLDAVVDAAAHYFQVPAAHLVDKAKGKTRTQVYQRKVLIWLLSRESEVPGREIGRMLGISFQYIYQVISEMDTLTTAYDDVKADIAAIRAAM